MFVAIDNKDMDALKVEEWINHTRDANGGVISPEFAMEVLGKTNHFAHIKKVLKHIKKGCSDENGELVTDKVLAYKEFILSCVDRREMSPQAMVVLQEMAEKIGCKDEFDEVNDKTKIYELKDCENVDVKIVKSKEEFKALKGEGLRVFFDADEVYLYGCDLSGVEKIKFREGAEVDLCSAENLPKDLDISMCSEVNLIYCDFNGVEKIKFREGAVVNLSYTKHLPKVLDLSMCSNVDLRGHYLNGVEKIKFREGAKVDLRGTKKLPTDLDVSMCSMVDLSGCDLKGVEKINFREGAVVGLGEASNLPKDLDVSMCSRIDLYGCDLKGVEEIKFKNETQFNESGFNGKYDGVKNFTGKVIIASKTLINNNDFSM